MRWLALLLAIEFCNPHCTGSAWELRLDGEPIVTGRDMTKEECAELYWQIEPQTPPFSLLQCVEMGVERQDL